MFSAMLINIDQQKKVMKKKFHGIWKYHILKRRGEFSKTKNFKLNIWKNNAYYLNFRLIIQDIKAHNSYFYVQVESLVFFYDFRINILIWEKSPRLLNLNELFLSIFFIKFRPFLVIKKFVKQKSGFEPIRSAGGGYFGPWLLLWPLKKPNLLCLPYTGWRLALEDVLSCHELFLCRYFCQNCDGIKSRSWI